MLISFFVVVLVTLVGLRLPLLRTLGYEFSVLMGLLGYAVSFTWGVAAFDPKRDSTGADFPIAVCRKGFVFLGYLLVLFSIPILIHIVHNLLGDQCKIFSRKGIGIYLFVVPAGLFHGLGLGMLFRQVVKDRRIAWGMGLLYFMASAAWSLVQCYVGPRMTCHNLIIGMASVGAYTGFDTELKMDGSFYWLRALVVAAGVAFFSLTVWHRMRRQEMERGEVAHMAFLFARRVSVGVGILFLVCFLFARDETGLGSGRRRLARILPNTHESEHFVIHHASGHPQGERLRRLAEDCEWHYHKISQALKLKSKDKVHAYFYPSAQEQWLATGASGFLFAVPWNREFHTYLTSTGAAALRHELVHVLSEEFGCPILRISTQYGLVEGVAVAVDEGYWEDTEIHEAVAAAQKADVLAPAHQFMSTRGFGSMSMARSYTFAGSFCGYLMMIYGQDSFKQLYGSVRPQYKEIYGKHLDQLSRDWEQFLNTVAVSPKAVRDSARRFNPVTFPAFYKRRCPRLGSTKDEKETPYEEADRHAREERFDQALSMYEEFLRREHGNPKWLLRIASVYERKGQEDKAMDVLYSVPGLDKVQPVLVDEAYERLSKIHRKRGEWEKALEAVQKRIDYGYQPRPDRLELEMRILDHPTLRTFLVRAQDSAEDQARDLYNEAARLEPESSLPYFFLGRCASWGERAYDPYLAAFCYRFLDLEEGVPYLKAITLLEVGRSAYWAGRMEEAAHCFERALDLDVGGTTQREIREWVERVEWRSSIGCS